MSDKRPSALAPMLVPSEPSEAMLDAAVANGAAPTHGYALAVWKVMVDAYAMSDKTQDELRKKAERSCEQALIDLSRALNVGPKERAKKLDPISGAMWEVVRDL